MTRVIFVSTDGEQRSEVTGAPGQRLLEVAQSDGQPLEGTCEGQMACSTCHVIIDAADFAKLPRATEMEEDLLDLASHVTRFSRLACQIHLTDAIDSLTVRMPAGARNMQGR
ncbi:2Fe-2S iron-sulfur cluster-binding protein [Rhizorhabdus sp.]|jgi:ferredoxin|uniref:2Fe-2S iron-sulfur cluster-binding protein n=1 Tax=Rhizorhabdus sp. TaxID=1968843 RepID=UPI001219AE63|nr:2Fe-2S iron-sulfur cluster-binding protein [Rhizorhabdus sp.]MBD3761347.1 2Fe-2S iron-sulfur cluster binding domain-containing protein [Rhizorhabdus sp.]TAK09284.1 MAG: 2Fe-2S iron-sulfur cluster binding domain-containing protein [Rhizorhabdus sp.]